MCVFNVVVSMLGSCFTLHLMLRSSMIREMAQVKMRRKLVLIINTNLTNDLVSFSISILILKCNFIEITVDLIVIVCWRKCAHERAFRKTQTIIVASH